MDKDKNKNKRGVLHELASCIECEDDTVFWAVLLLFFLVAFIAFVVYVVVTFVDDEESMDPIRPFIYHLPYLEQNLVVRKLGVKSVYPRGARQLKAKSNLTFAFELAFATRIATSLHVVDNLASADLFFLGFYPSMTRYCYTNKRCQGEEFQSSFDATVIMYGEELRKIDPRIPVFVGIGESDPPLMRYLVKAWKRSLIFVTPYLLNTDETVEVVDGLSYTTVVTALPDLSVCGSKCVKQLQKESISIIGELARKEEGIEEDDETSLTEEETEDDADDEENAILANLLGKTLYNYVYASKNARKKYTVLVASDVTDYPYFAEATETENIKRMKAVNLSRSVKKKVWAKARRKYRTYLKNSKFCVHLFEDIRDVSGFFDGVIGGCIPILPKSRRWKFPYEDSYEWDYSTFSFVVDFKHVPSILAYIDSLPLEEVRKKQYALFMIKRRVSWYSSKSYRKHRAKVNMRDAFDLTLLEVFYRAVLEPQRLQLEGPCQFLSFAFPKLTQMKDLLLPEVANFVYNCFNISVSPNDFLVNWLDLNYGKQEL